MDWQRSGEGAGIDLVRRDLLVRYDGIKYYTRGHSIARALELPQTKDSLTGPLARIPVIGSS